MNIFLKGGSIHGKCQDGKERVVYLDTKENDSLKGVPEFHMPEDTTVPKASESGAEVSSTKRKRAPKQTTIINVQPLRTKEEIDDFKWALMYAGKMRDVILFSIGINTGLRVSDIVPLKVKDVRGKTHISLIELKTGKIKKSRLSPILIDEIDRYTKTMTSEDYLFPSQMSDSYITTTQAYRVMQKAAKVLEREDIGTHTMRKTFGYMYYKRTKDVAALQIIFNHSSPSITLKYIGITEEEIDKSLEDFYL